MKKKRLNYLTSISSNIITFFMGLIYITIPAYYGINNIDKIDPNNLFLSMIFVYIILNVFEYFFVKNTPEFEPIYVSIVASIAGVVNILLAYNFSSSLALSIAVIVFVILYTGLKLFVIDYYHDRKDFYFYIEIFLLIIFMLIGVVTAFNLHNDKVLQIVMIGFFFLIVAIIEGFNTTIKWILKDYHFTRKIKLK